MKAVKRMNQIHKYSSVEWYIEQIKRLIVHKNTSKKNFEKKYHEEERKFSNYLIKQGITSDCFSTVNGTNVFENFITAEYDDLVKLSKKHYNINDEVPQQFKKLYDKFSNNGLNNLIIQSTNISVCPYCNENYILNRGEKHTSAQLDYFFDKSDNPLFSICLYNLIPCCYACNHIKSNKPINVSPFNESIDREQLRISFEPSSADFITNKSSMAVNFLAHGDDGQKILDDLKLLNIYTSYQSHNDYLNELIKKAYIYNDSRIKELYDLLGNTVASKEELYRLIFGNYIDYSNINSRPLSKLTQDILKELKIIK